MNRLFQLELNKTHLTGTQEGVSDATALHRLTGYAGGLANSEISCQLNHSLAAAGRKPFGSHGGNGMSLSGL